jgi:hypothetical protein
MEHPKQTAESTAKNVMRFSELKDKSVPIMFIDSMTTRHYRMNYAVIGDTASENPDYEIQRAMHHASQLSDWHGWAPPHNGPAWHTHDYIESFFILKGPWRFYWGNEDDPAKAEGYIDVNDGIQSPCPPGTYRGFEYIGEEIGRFFAVLESHRVFEGKDPYCVAQY